jgi:anionic cell wall polymer biosynthesis LytR-Cps2A-Psr (LCP) family protein
MAVIAILSISFAIFLFSFSIIWSFVVANAKMRSIEQVIDSVAQERILSSESEVSFGDVNQINILLIGLDGRIKDENPHCDAIHFLTLDIENWKITITSVPRGTYAYIPQQLAPTEYYLANACSYEGLEYGIEQIEKVVGIRADYIITINFSQALGILRLFDFPTTETLEWLRHRQSYQIGDPQRSHNQGVFIKDMILNHLSKFRSDFSLPVQYLMYSFVDTDMDFAVATALLNGFLSSSIDSRPDDIVLQMRPYFETIDYHFDATKINDQIDAWEERLRPYLSTNDLTGVSNEEIQASIISYLQDVVMSKQDIERVVDEQLWLQVEDEQIREKLNYDLITTYVSGLYDTSVIINLMSLYILEKETLGKDDWAQKGKEFLINVIE